MSAEDLALWEALTRDVKRLPGKTYRAVPPVPVSRAAVKKPVAGRTAPPPAAAASPKGRETDRRTSERLRRGQIAPEARLDLHGMNQGQARAALKRFILSAHETGKRCVLVITGKGKTRAGAGSWLAPEPGVLRKKVPEWLEEPPLRDLVLKIQEARLRDGGGGALYVLLRRKK